MAELLAPGSTFHGAYTIGRLIGRGGIGEVYEAKHEFLGRRVAIKCLRVRSTLPKTAAQRMAKEAQALCTLDHPNIIRIYDAGVHGDFVFMVTELLEGGTLRDKLEAERRMMLLPALRYHVEWADALVQVHAAGIIHRDLKPENVFITKGGLSKVLDFGAALDSQRITMHGHTVGTPAYMAPEHLTGDLEIDPRADVYPMGVMLYEALTGQHPFVLPTDQDLPDHFEFARRHLFEPWPKLTQVMPGMPPAVEAIVDRCLAKNRDERFPTMAALREALRNALEAANQPTAVPLVQRAPDAVSKTKPMPRQTAMRLERGLTSRMTRMTERMTPVPIGGAIPTLSATAPLDPARMHHRAAPTLEDRSPATATPPPLSPAIAMAASSKVTLPSRAPAAIAVLSVGAITLIALLWLLLRSGGSSPASAEVTASATVEPPPAASASVAPTSTSQVADAPTAASAAAPSPAPEVQPSASAVASSESAAASATIPAPSKPVARPVARPRQQTTQTAKPSGPVPIFE